MNKDRYQMMDIRLETPDDIEAIHAVNAAAFRTDGEAKVVDRLREICHPFISLVAEVNGKVVGHILFTPVQLNTSKDLILDGMGLAPLAVLPEYQSKGIGSALCESGLEKIRAMGTPFVVVLGHPGYYPHFGFKPAADFGIRSAYPDVPPEAFMIKIYDRDLLHGVKGVVQYRPEFDEVI